MSLIGGRSKVATTHMQVTTKRVLKVRGVVQARVVVDIVPEVTTIKDVLTTVANTWVTLQLGDDAGTICLLSFFFDLAHPCHSISHRTSG